MTNGTPLTHGQYARLISEVIKNVPADIERDAFDAWMKNGNGLKQMLTQLCRLPFNPETWIELQRDWCYLAPEIYIKKLRDAGVEISDFVANLFELQHFRDLTLHKRTELVKVRAGDFCNPEETSRQGVIYAALRAGLEPVYATTSLMVLEQHADQIGEGEYLHLGMLPVRPLLDLYDIRFHDGCDSRFHPHSYRFIQLAVYKRDGKLGIQSHQIRGEKLYRDGLNPHAWWVFARRK